MATEDRLVDVEIRIARQEDMLDALNNTVYQQQKKIDELEALCSALARHLKDLKDVTADAPSEALLERPPHY